MFLFQPDQSAASSGAQLIDWIKVLAPIIAAAIAIIGVGIAAFFTIRRGLLDKRYEYASTILNFRISQLLKFYAPMQLLIEKSRQIYEKFKWTIEKEKIIGFDPHEFRLLDHIAEYCQDAKLRPLIDEIIKTGKEMSTLITNKGGLIEGGITNSFIEYQAHLSILLAALEGEVSGDSKHGWQEFGYYPRLLNREVREGYKAVLQHLNIYLEAGDELVFKLLKKKPLTMNFSIERQQLLQNLAFYEKNIKEYATNFDRVDISDIYKKFLNELKRSKNNCQKQDQKMRCILDAGSGTGRDTSFFISNGYKVIAFDVSPGMARECNRKIYIQKKDNIESAKASKCLELDFEEINFLNEFDGVWAAASLLHVHQYKMSIILKKLINALKPGGVIYISFKYGRGTDEFGNRFFHYYNRRKIRRIIKKIYYVKEMEIWLTEEKDKKVKSVKGFKQWLIWRLENLWFYNNRKLWLNVLVRKEMRT